MSKHWTPDSVYDLLGDATTRDILELTSTRPASADDLADHLDVSPPTVYRRIHALQEYDLVEEAVHVDEHGNHYNRFTATLSEIHVTLDDGDLTADVERDTDLTDKLSSFWRDLETGADPGDPTPDDTSLGHTDPSGE